MEIKIIKSGYDLIIKKELSNGVNLYTSSPFEYNVLNVSCDKCKNFWTNSLYFPSGKCKKYNSSCGSGNACEDYIYYL